MSSKLYIVGLISSLLALLYVYNKNMPVRSFSYLVILFICLTFTSSCDHDNENSPTVPGITGYKEDSPFLMKGNANNLEGIYGPKGISPKIKKQQTDWSLYSKGNHNRLAVYIKNVDSGWLGLVHGFKAFGIPFRLTDSIDAALLHNVVIVYPRLRDKDLETGEADKLRDFVHRGGTLIAVMPQSDELKDLFSYTEFKKTRDHWELKYSRNKYASDFTFNEERVIRIGNPELKRARPKTISYSDPSEIIASYNDGSAAIIQNTYNDGSAIAFGFDVGMYIKRAQNNRDEEASRTYVNDFEPSVDTILRLFWSIYSLHEPSAARLHTVPSGFPLAVIISHDVDYAGSLSNSIEYAEYEKSMGYGATYFMQTKYFQDFFDKVFFSDKTSELLHTLESLGMELGSHSVCHSDMFAKVPQGTYKETYPDYQPRIIEYSYTRDASIMGELRVSKFLIESYSNSNVTTFRPGFLANPFSLPESLVSAGYKYSSAVTANDVMTHLPFRQTYSRLYRMELPIYEFPITIEDEFEPRMDQRVSDAVSLAKKISRYGGLFVVLIHPDITDYKLKFLKEFTPLVRDWSWWGTHAEYGDWWAKRDMVELDIEERINGTYLKLICPKPIQGLGIKLPTGFTIVDKQKVIKNGFLIMDAEKGLTQIELEPVSN